MLPQLIVFDLDGTLIDSQIDLANSVNATLEHMGKPRLPLAVIASYIGDGASMLVRRALGDPEGDSHDEEDVDEAVEYFLDYYRDHKLDFTYVYEGVIEALNAIQTEWPTVQMAVLTNKPVRPSREICTHLGLEKYFFQNFGGNSFHTKKPDPAGLLALIAEAGSQPENTVMVGDLDADVLTAKNCGARSLGCAYGLGVARLLAANPDAVAQSPAEWLKAIQSL